MKLRVSDTDYAVVYEQSLVDYTDFFPEILTYDLGDTQLRNITVFSVRIRRKSVYDCCIQTQNRKNRRFFSHYDSLRRYICLLFTNIIINRMHSTP